MRSVSRSLPGLMRSQKIQEKAAKAGFDWDNVNGALDKLEEEIAELKQAIKITTVKISLRSLAMCFFSGQCLEVLGVDSEKALYFSCDKFIERFDKVEQAAKEQGIDMKDADLNTLDSLWNQAKE